MSVSPSSASIRAEMPEEISGCENAISPFSTVTTLAAIAAVRSTGSLIAASSRGCVGAEHSAATWRRRNRGRWQRFEPLVDECIDRFGHRQRLTDGDRVTLPRQRPSELERVERITAGDCMDALKRGPGDDAVQLLAEHSLDRAEAQRP